MARANKQAAEGASAPLTLPEPTLDERIKELHRDLEEYIEARIEMEHVAGVPDGVVRNMLLRSQCLCKAVRRLKQEES